MSLHLTVTVLIAIHVVGIASVALDVFRIKLAHDSMEETGTDTRLPGTGVLVSAALMSAMAGGAAGAMVLYFGIESAGGNVVSLHGGNGTDFLYMVILAASAAGLLATSEVFHIVSGKLLAKCEAEIED